jgi:hypothetical protein
MSRVNKNFHNHLQHYFDVLKPTLANAPISSNNTLYKHIQHTLIHLCSHHAYSVVQRCDTMFAMYHTAILTTIKPTQSFSLVYWLPVYQHASLTIAVLQNTLQILHILPGITRYHKNVCLILDMIFMLQIQIQLYWLLIIQTNFHDIINSIITEFHSVSWDSCSRLKYCPIVYLLFAHKQNGKSKEPLRNLQWSLQREHQVI